MTTARQQWKHEIHKNKDGTTIYTQDDAGNTIESWSAFVTLPAACLHDNMFLIYYPGYVGQPDGCLHVDHSCGINTSQLKGGDVGMIPAYYYPMKMCRTCGIVVDVKLDMREVHRIFTESN